MEAKEPNVDYSITYTYADYLKLTIEDRFEVIKGKLFKMSPAPSTKHQSISVFISNKIYNYLNYNSDSKNSCKLFTAPFDVRLAKRNARDEEITTVVQPDICVICDETKLDDAGCIGAPDIVVEILSKSNNRKELSNKFEVYEENGVLEYWIVHPEEKTITIYELTNGKFIAGRMLTEGDIVTSKILPGFELDIEAIFNKIA
ncbi:MAG: Uma2 family endonuclease [Bacteroidia bacterium]